MSRLPMGRLAFVGGAVLVVVGALAAAPRLAGQSVLAAGGLGIPIDAVDARGRALGSVGPGLFGTGVLPGDPTASLDLTVPTLTFSMQNSWLSVDQAGAASEQTASRFPALGVAHPVRNWGILSLTYGAFLDQRWQFQEERRVDLAAGGSTTVTDRFVSDGGVSVARVGFSRRLSPGLGVGAALGRYTGSTLRRYTRTFDSLGVNVPIAPFTTGGRWGYSGLLADVAVVIDVADVVRASAALEWSSALAASPDSGTVGASHSYDLPLQLRAGVSGNLAPGLAAVVSAAYADWTDTGADLEVSGSAGATFTVGTGIEWDRATVFGRGVPLRLSWRRTELPFRFGGQDPVETTVGGGAGLVLARAGALPLGAVDVAVERGSRAGGTVVENFWRSTVSFRISGF